jgi:hypothetical protein
MTTCACAHTCVCVCVRICIYISLPVFFFSSRLFYDAVQPVWQLHFGGPQLEAWNTIQTTARHLAAIRCFLRGIHTTIFFTLVSQCKEYFTGSPTILASELLGRTFGIPCTSVFSSWGVTIVLLLTFQTGHISTTQLLDNSRIHPAFSGSLGDTVHQLVTPYMSHSLQWPTSSLRFPSRGKFWNIIKDI